MPSFVKYNLTRKDDGPMLVKTLKQTGVITFGTLLMALGIYFFRFPNNFSTGGVTGISVVLSAFVPLSKSTLVLMINVLFLVLGFFCFGKNFAFKTVYCSLLLSGMLCALEWMCPLSAPLTGQPVMELAFAVLLPAAGSAILFNEHASSGGTDVAAMLLKNYTGLDVGKALVCVDVLIVAVTAFVYGIEIGLFSLLGLLARSLVIDSVIENINLYKYFTIITAYPDEICDFINKNLHRGATVSECSGAFTHEDRRMVLTVLRRGQAVILKSYIRQIDPHAFVIIANSSDIIGKGFRSAI